MHAEYGKISRNNACRGCFNSLRVLQSPSHTSSYRSLTSLPFPALTHQPRDLSDPQWPVAERAYRKFQGMFSL